MWVMLTTIRFLSEELKSLNQSLVAENTSLQRRFNEKMALMKELEAKLNEKITAA